MYNTQSILSVQSIFSKIDEYQIFAFYLGKDFRIGKKYTSPFRKDKSPSFGIFMSKSGSLYYKDMATNEFGTAIDFVMKVYSSKSFSQVLSLINTDLNLGLLDTNPIETAMPRQGFNTDYTLKELKSTGEVSHVEISIIIRKWQQIDIDFWKQFGLSVDVLTAYNVFPCEKVFINGRAIIYSPRMAETLTYAYAFFKDGEYSYKIYRPFNAKYKWLSNSTTSVLQGWTQLPETHRVLIITKSLKDVMVLRTLGIPAIAVQGELQGIKRNVYDLLKQRFQQIYVLFDFDLGGVLGVQLFRKNIPECKFFFIQDFKTRHDGNKDISDYRKKHTPEQCITHLRNSLLKWNPNL